MSRSEGSTERDYRFIEVDPLTPAIGAMISGVDLAMPLKSEVFSEIHRAFLAHQIVFFRHQRLSPEQHKAFASRFGPLVAHPFVQPIEGHEEIIEVLKDVGDQRNFGGRWHSDLSFLPAPPLGAVLVAREVPDVGGDTLFANLYQAYESLSVGMKRLADGLVAIHSAAHVYGPNAAARPSRGRSSMRVIPTEAAAEEVSHPLVRTHPETGRRLLFITSNYVRRFHDMTEEESAPLIEHFLARATAEAHTCRVRWERDMVAVWDNRCTLHYALNDYHGKRRLMHRVAIGGDRPF